MSRQGPGGRIAADATLGELLRVGHERYLPGLRRLVEAVHEASGGETLLLLQTIDFLAIKRRPARDKYFARFLVVTERHRRALASIHGIHGQERWLVAPE